MHAQPDFASSPPTWHSEYIPGFVVLHWDNGSIVAKPPRLQFHWKLLQTMLQMPQNFLWESSEAMEARLHPPTSSHARLHTRKSWLPLSKSCRFEDADRDSGKKKSCLPWQHQS